MAKLIMSFFDLFDREDESGNQKEFIAQTIPKWSGRFGNMIIHLMNSYIIARHHKYKYLEINKNKLYNIKYKLLNVYNHTNIIDTDIIDSLHRKNTKINIHYPYFALHSKNFFYNFSIDQRLYFSKHLDNIMDLDSNGSFTNKDSLYIHIRATDIYHNSKQTCVYSQPPISFYEKVVLDNNFKHIYILSDDNNSFVVNLLYNKFGANYCTVIEAGAKESFNILRYANNVCSSTSSFFTTACLSTPANISKNIFTYEYLTNIYHHWFFTDLFDGSKIYNTNFNNIKFHIYRINNYQFMNNVSKFNDKPNIEDRDWWKNSNSDFTFNWLFNNNTKELMTYHDTKNIIKIYG